MTAGPAHLAGATDIGAERREAHDEVLNAAHDRGLAGTTGLDLLLGSTGPGDPGEAFAPGRDSEAMAAHELDDLLGLLRDADAVGQVGEKAFRFSVLPEQHGICGGRPAGRPDRAAQ